MKLHPDVIEAANWGVAVDMAFEGERARRVLLAQAQPEAISDGMIQAAKATYRAMSNPSLTYEEVWRAAISAALLHIVEGE